MRLSRVCVLALWLILSSRAADNVVVARTQAEVEKLIETEGSTPPPWFDSVKLNYPPTLLLHWERPRNKEPWTPNKYLAQYIWSVINENPGRWREGLKF